MKHRLTRAPCCLPLKQHTQCAAAYFNRMVKKTLAKRKKSSKRTKTSKRRGTKRFGRLLSATAMRPEIKGCDIDLPNENIIQDVATNGNIYLINGLIQGTGSWNRIGRKIEMKNLSAKLSFTLQLANINGTSNAVAPVLRYLIVYDRQPNKGPIPAFEEIFSELNNAGSQSTTVFSGLTYGQMDRYVILRDKFVCPELAGFMSQAGVAEGALMTHLCEEFVKLSGLVTEYDTQSNAGTIADITSGALYLILRSDFYGDPATNNRGHWALSGSSFMRLRFKD